MAIACTPPKPQTQEDFTHVSGLLQPVSIHPGSNYLYLDEFFLKADEIDSVRINSIDCQYDTTTYRLDFIIPENYPVLSECRVWIENTSFTLLMKHFMISDSPRPQLTSVSSTQSTIKIKTTDSGVKIIALWDNFSLGENFINIENNEISIRIPYLAAGFDRSSIRVYGMNDGGLSNDLLIPLINGKVMKYAEQGSRNDKVGLMMYFLLVDRFQNGDYTNDMPVQDAELDPRANYQGGDLAGVMQKLNEGYFDSLGVNTLWLSPITQNTMTAYREYPEPHRKFSGYHGYWPISLNQVDIRFGTGATLRQLASRSHEKNMNLLLDFVSNHVHEEAPIIQQHPDWKTNVDLPDGRKNIRLWDEQRLTTWFDSFLPSLDYDKPEVVDMMTDSVLFWLTEYDLDGFRHDATKHIPDTFWRSLTKKIHTYEKSKQKNIFQIGETYGDRALTGSYVGSNMLDGQFDFNLYWDMRNCFVKEEEPMSNLAASIEQSLQYYGYHHTMGNITSNHDMPRITSYLGGALKFEDDARELAWTDSVGVGDELAYQKMKCMAALIFTLPGVPVIYYGDEIGMPGAADPDNRRPMQFDHLTDNQKDLKTTFRDLATIRKENIALQYGDYKLIETCNKLLVFERRYFEKRLIILVNKDSAIREVELPDHLGKVKVGAWDYLIIDPQKITDQAMY